jgi:hypothetical protein
MPLCSMPLQLMIFKRYTNNTASKITAMSICIMDKLARKCAPESSLLPLAINDYRNSPSLPSTSSTKERAMQSPDNSSDPAPTVADNVLGNSRLCQFSLQGLLLRFKKRCIIAQMDSNWWSVKIAEISRNSTMNHNIKSMTALSAKKRPNSPLSTLLGPIIYSDMYSMQPTSECNSN